MGNNLSSVWQRLHAIQIGMMVVAQGLEVGFAFLIDPFAKTIKI